MISDNFHRDARKERERALVAAYMATGGRKRDGILDTGGPIARGGDATMKGLWRLGKQLSGFNDVKMIASAFAGNERARSELQRNPLPFQAGMRVKAKDPWEGVGKLWRDKNFEPGLDTPLPKTIDRDARGVPLEAHTKPPSVENFLGDVWLRRFTNEKRKAVGMVGDNERKRVARFDGLIDHKLSEIEELKQLGDEFNQMQDLERDLDDLIMERNQLEEGLADLPQEYDLRENVDRDLDSLQFATNNLWAARRGRAMEFGEQSPHQAGQFDRKLDDYRTLKDYLDGSQNSRITNWPLSQKLQKLEKELAQLQMTKRKPSWYLPPKLNDLLGQTPPRGNG